MSEGARTSTPERRVPLGQIVGTHGVGGLLRFHPYSGSAAALSAPRIVYLEPRPSRGAKSPQPVEPVPFQEIHLESAQPHGRVVLLRFADVESIEAAASLVGTVLTIPERDLPATGPDEFYVYQLEGLEVVTSGGERVGTVDHSFPTGSNDVLVVRDGDREHLIPVIADVVRRVDLTDRTIVIDAIEGLLD